MENICPNCKSNSIVGLLTGSHCLKCGSSFESHNSPALKW